METVRASWKQWKLAEMAGNVRFYRCDQTNIVAFSTVQKSNMILVEAWTFSISRPTRPHQIILDMNQLYSGENVAHFLRDIPSCKVDEIVIDGRPDTVWCITEIFFPISLLRSENTQTV